MFACPSVLLFFNTGVRKGGADTEEGVVERSLRPEVRSLLTSLTAPESKELEPALELPGC